MNLLFGLNWSAWNWGRALLKRDYPDISGLDIYTLAKLLSTLVRQDRFMSGTLSIAFRTGLAQRLLAGLHHAWLARNSHPPPLGAEGSHIKDSVIRRSKDLRYP